MTYRKGKKHKRAMEMICRDVIVTLLLYCIHSTPPPPLLHSRSNMKHVTKDLTQDEGFATTKAPKVGPCLEGLQGQILGLGSNSKSYFGVKPGALITIEGPTLNPNIGLIPDPEFWAETLVIFQG